jgi:hypothetical protein
MSRWLLTYEVEVDALTEFDAVDRARQILRNDPPEPISIDGDEEDE